MPRIYQIYYGFLLKYKRRFFAFGLSLILLTVAETIQPYFYKLFIEALPQNNSTYLIQLLVIYFLIKLVAVLFDVSTGYLGDAVVIPAARDARLAVFKRVQELDFAYHLSKSTGSLISTFKRGDNAFFDFFIMVNRQLAQNFLSFLVLLLFFFQINWLVALLLFASFSANLILARFLIRYNITTRAAYNNSEDKISDIIVDNLINFETVKLFAKENKEYDRLGHQFKDWTQKLWKFTNSFRIIDISVGTLANIGFFFILLISLQRVFSLQISVANYVAILAFLSSFYPRFFEAIYYLRNVAKNQVDMDRYLRVLDEPLVVKDPLKPVNHTNVKGTIEFRDISFSYPESSRNAIKNINFIIKPGQSVAFVGHSGVGKTTITKLLMRFYDPTHGQILLDGINIKRFSKSQLRSFMGVVPQEPILFNDTIGYNIGYGADNPTLPEIQGAAKLANLDTFIESLPHGYDTQVGERGVKLSGGQKQRLAIARMILSNPSIVIFDEATSQLDSDSEKKIQAAFWSAVKNKTTIIIAHRLSTIAKAEKIIVMADGQIAEVGSHRQLLADPHSLYSHFWSLQSQPSATA